MEIEEQLKSCIAWAGKASAQSVRFGDELEGQGRRLRPSVGGLSLISYRSDTPQLGFSGLKTEADLARVLSKPLAAPGRRTPEKELQSFLIREAVGSAGRLPSLEAILGDQLWFVTDELAFTAYGAKLVADLLLVRVRSGQAELFQIELKSSRSMKEVFGQVLAFRPLLEDQRLQDLWRELAAAMTGQSFKWDGGLGGARGLVVWPRCPNPASSAATQRRADYPRVDAIGYVKNESDRFGFSRE